MSRQRTASIVSSMSAPEMRMIVGASGGAHNNVFVLKLKNRRFPASQLAWNAGLPSLVKADTVGQVRKTGVVAYGIKNRMYLQELQKI